MIGFPLLPKKIRQASSDDEKNAISAIYFLMKELNMQYTEVLDLPLPAFFMLLAEAEKEAKRIKRQMRKAK